MTGRVYCTYFDHNYLTRGLALYFSLQRHSPGARLWVLCLSEACHKALIELGLPNLVPTSLSDFEAADPEVAATRASRSTIEYYFTCSPALMLFVLGREPDAEWVTYLDGDLYFFSSPEPIYAELCDGSVAIIPHRYTARIARLRKFGTYNVGWVGVRNDSEGKRVIEWWRAKCIDWCRDYVDGDRFADQGYLDSFPGLSPRVKIVENIGANLAPWNIGNYRVAVQDDLVVVNEAFPLIFFHFQGLRKDLGYFIFNSHRQYRAPFTPIVRKHVYKPYIDELLSIEKMVGPVVELSKVKPHARSTSIDFTEYLRSRLRRFGTRCFQLADILTGRAFVVSRDSRVS